MTRRLVESKHLDAAAMLARDVPIVEIARQVGVSRMTVYNWSKTEEAQRHIAAIRASVAEATKHLAVADKVRRIQLGQQMVDGILATIGERREAGRQAQTALPGQATGHVVVKEKTLGKGAVRREAAFDASIHAELRKWLEYVAHEQGELEKRLTITGRIDHIVSRPDLSALTDDELEALLPLAEKVAAGEVTS